MRLTRQGWAAALAGLVLVVLGVLLARPVLLVGGAVVGAWLVASAIEFARRLERTLEGLTIDQRPQRDRVVTGRQLPITLGASLSTPSELSLDIESRPPVSTSAPDGATRRVTIGVDSERAETTYHAAWPHAGIVAFDPPTVTATDPLERFEATVATGPAPTVTVAPRAPRDIHVGQGGERVVGAFGEHRTGRRGSGLEPAELRAYVPGDAADRIDWKATARLAEPYVREYEAQTDRQTVIVFDHRAPLGRGQPGETALDYLREVALAYVETARAFDDPLGCFTVGDEGLTGRWLPEVDRRQSARIARHLGRLEPTAGDGRGRTTRRGASDARRVADRLRNDGSTFARTLAPYFDEAAAYVSRIDGNPLYEAVRSVRQTIRGPVWTVVFTDDTDLVSLERALGVARRGEGRALVYLAPSALFEPGGLADLDAAYDRYVAFEERRRELSRPDGVDAFEVAPGDRVEAVLAAGRDRRRRAPAGGS